jgi:hypothetical protein
MSNPLTEILAAARAHHDARAAAPDERARQRITNQFWREQNQRQQALAIEFGQVNRWRLTTRPFGANDIGTCRYNWRGAAEHALYYRDATRRNVALVAQPYVTAEHCTKDWLVKLKANYAARGLCCHAPPQVFASFWVPGCTAFLVITKPDITVQWLPEQLAWQPEPRPLQVLAR